MLLTLLWQEGGKHIEVSREVDDCDAMPPMNSMRSSNPRNGRLMSDLACTNVRGCGGSKIGGRVGLSVYAESRGLSRAGSVRGK